MKRTIALALIAFIPVLYLSSCKKGDVAVKIDDEKITIPEFNNYYYMQNKLLMNMDKAEIDKVADDPQIENHPTLNKSRFLDFLISRKLLYEKAMKDDKINKEELKTIVELAQMQAAATYYLTEKLGSEITVSDKEADEFYRQNPQLFKGVPVNDAVIDQIKRQIKMQKLEQKSNQYIFDVMAEHKINREGFREYIKNQEKAKNDTESKKEAKKDAKKK